MSATTTPSVTAGAISGTPVLFYPVPTPWPMAAGWDKNIYREHGDGLILAYDPIYPLIINKLVLICWRPERRKLGTQTKWGNKCLLWLQKKENNKRLWRAKAKEMERASLELRPYSSLGALDLPHDLVTELSTPPFCGESSAYTVMLKSFF